MSGSVLNCWKSRTQKAPVSPQTLRDQLNHRLYLHKTDFGVSNSSYMLYAAFGQNGIYDIEVAIRAIFMKHIVAVYLLLPHNHCTLGESFLHMIIHTNHLFDVM